MGIKKHTARLFVLLLLMGSALPGQDENILLGTIAGNIERYKAQTVTLRLKLKYYDRIFERISFYDSKNHDIEFDISKKDVKKRIEKDILNLHEGMDYLVTFIVVNVGNLGELTGELKGFKPVILDKIPNQ